ncbi:Fic family protein [Argonema antarcticum]|uniref:Fic family protein n=1 Tax=Argonema antarcticum TaxID=2942763 RepID=UPI0020136880|nr:Fic family protein [Argonema antarcticum]MCL1473111.1 Fic family protein [Argonema antarcticum A004/B2]
MRSGRYIQQIEGYSAFIPAPLPPKPPIKMDAELNRLLSNADRALGRLDGATSILPNPDLFVAMYVRQEAVLSSQIEGTQSTLEDVLQYEIDATGEERFKDVQEVVNYVNAMNYGLQRLQELPLCLRLLKEIHAELLEDVRGSDRTPGEFRKSQNWIGPQGCNLATAAFIPPPVAEMHKSLHNLEKFLHDTNSLPVLIHCGLAHAQFETIHPFLDGNGRIGRLLITFLLCQQQILQKPLLYLSHYLKFHRMEYYDRLMAIRTHGDWEGWLKFFLKGIFEVSQSATATARSILEMREKHREIIGQQIASSSYGLRFLDLLFQHPIVNIRLVEDELRCTYATASKTVEKFVEVGLLHEVTGWQRNRLYRYEPYLSLFESSYSLINPENSDSLPSTQS